MTDETETVGEVARVLGEHHGWAVTGERVRTTDVTVYGCRGCPAEIWRDEEHKGWTAPAMRERFAAHQAAMLAEAGLLRDHVTIDALNQRCQILVDEGDGLRAQIATQEPAGEPVAPPEGVGTSGTLSARLRALIPATYADDGYFGVTALEIGEFADEAERLESTHLAADLRENTEALMNVRAQVGRVQALAQWFRDQGQTGYARKVEEALEGTAPEPVSENPFRMPEDRA